MKGILVEPDWIGKDGGGFIVLLNSKKRNMRKRAKEREWGVFCRSCGWYARTLLVKSIHKLTVHICHPRLLLLNTRVKLMQMTKSLPQIVGLCLLKVYAFWNWQFWSKLQTWLRVGFEGEGSCSKFRFGTLRPSHHHVDPPPLPLIRPGGIVAV